MIASTTIKACALSLILFTGSACAQSQNLESSKNLIKPQAQQVSDNIIATNNYKPGINRVTFQSEGEKIVGNLYLPANNKSGDKLPAVVVTGA